MKKKRNRVAKLLMVSFIGIIGFVWFSANNPFQAVTNFFTPVSQTAFASEANQKISAASSVKAAPLILQTDEEWGTESYGFSEGNEENTLALNGCAIASLAMVLSYWQDQKISPLTILAWSQNNYYVAEAGTAWSIFADFASQYQLQYIDLGTDIYGAQSYLEQGIPVIASVTAGDFTNGGHILVLRDWTAEGISVNDPNDAPDKNHFEQRYQPEQIASQAIHYWTFTA